jgi:hypothetical protein
MDASSEQSACHACSISQQERRGKLILAMIES